MVARPRSTIARGPRGRILIAGVLSMVAWGALQGLSPRTSIVWSPNMLAAAQRMRSAIAVMRDYCDSVGIAIDRSIDPNRTCLIGPAYTPLFTTLGQLESKRTTTNPDMAALMVHLLDEASVSAGDTIAVGASASFPALLIAAQTAAEVIGAHPLIVASFGSSSYGATRPELNLLDIHAVLMARGLLRTAPAAVSLGGEDDVGTEFDPEVRERLQQRAAASGIPLLVNADLRATVAERMTVYAGSGADGRVAIFVNVGGSHANIGTSPMVLDVSPGLHFDLALPPEEQRGVLFEMAARGVPVVHLLHVRGLVLQFGLPWDPVPLPEPGATRFIGDRSRSPMFWLIVVAYLMSLGLVGFLPRRRPRWRVPA